MKKFIKSISIFERMRNRRLHIAFVLMGFLWAFSPLNAQILGNLQGGSTYPVITSKSYNGKVFTVSIVDDTKLNEKFEVCVFNGYYWTCLPEFSFPQAVLASNDPVYRITSVCELKGEVYIGGRFEGGSVANETNNFFKYDRIAGEWKSVANNIKTRNDGINQMVIYNDTLIAAGKFSSAGGTQVSNIAKFDGTNWSFLGSSNGTEGSNGEINALEIINDNLYVAGDFTEVGGQFTGSIARWKSGEGWGGIGSPFSNGETEYLKAYRDGLVAVGKTQTGDSVVRIFSGGLWYLPSLNTPQLNSAGSLPEPLIINDQLFLHGPFIDGQQEFDLVYLNQSKWLESSIDIPNDVNFETYNNEAVAFGSFNFNQDDRTFNNIIKLSNNKFVLKGKIFGDLNGNCSQDPLETGVQAQVQIQSTDFSREFYLVETDAQGNYEIELNLQKPYLVKAIFPKDRYQQGCASKVLLAQNSSSVIKEFNLGFDFSKAEYDLSLNSGALHGVISPTNKESVVYYFIQNTGNRPISNKSVHATLDERLSIVSVDPLPADRTNNKITWAINDLNPGETLILKIDIGKSTLPIGEKLNFFIRGGSGILNEDIDKVDNYDTLTTTVSTINKNTFKTVSKEGNFQSLDVLDYGIYFQNPTSRTIKTVVVVDTLDTDLPIERIRLTNISHNPQMVKRQIVQDNIYVLTYENVNLKSAENGAALSSGFFTYQFLMNDVAQKAVDQTYTNRASIIYEYQEEEITNTVETVLVKYSNVPDITYSSGLSAYPSPCDKNLTIRNHHQKDLEAVIYDLQGKVVSRFSLSALSSINLSTENLESGYYIIQTSEGSLKFAVQ